MSAAAVGAAPPSTAQRVPTVAWVAADGTLAVGEDARRAGREASHRLLRAITTRIGDSVDFVVGGSGGAAATVAVSEVLGALLHAVSAPVAPFDHLAIAHPADWGPFKQAVLLTAARAAEGELLATGGAAVSLVPAPVAAVTAWRDVSSTVPLPAGDVLHVHVGGSSIAAAVVRAGDGGVEVVGDAFSPLACGVRELDHQLVRLIVEDLVAGPGGEEAAAVIAHDPEAAGVLLDACEAAKCQLSRELWTDVELPVPGHPSRRVGRRELEELAGPLVAQAVDLAAVVVADAVVDEAALTAVLLTGGGARMPLVVEAFGRRFGDRVVVPEEPEAVVAHGAAILARRLAAPATALAGASTRRRDHDLGIAGLGPATVVARDEAQVTYRAEQLSSGAIVAVQVVDGGTLDPVARRRFVADCDTLRRLRHPGIVAMHDSGIIDDRTAFVVTDLVEVGTLQDRLDEEGPLPWRSVLTVAEQLARALDAAHRVGLVHGDIRPGNVVLDDDGATRIDAFAIAGVLESSSLTSITTSATALAFLPPEVFDGVRPDASRDVYGLAATVYALLAGHAPFAGTARGDRVPDLVQAISCDPVPALAVRGLPAAVTDVLITGLAKHPDDRPPTAGAFAARLRAAAAESLAVAEPPTPSGSPVPTDEPSTPPAVGAAPVSAVPAWAAAAPDVVLPFRPAAERARPSNALLAAVALLVVAVVAAAVVAVSRRGGGSDRVAPAVGAVLESTVLAGHGSWIEDVAWSPDGAQVASASADWSVRVWSPADGTSTIVWSHRSAVAGVDWSAQGRLVAVGADGTVAFPDPAAAGDDSSVPSVALGVAGRDVAWHPDGSVVAVAAVDGTIHLVEAPTSADGASAPPQLRATIADRSGSSAGATSAGGEATTVGWSRDGRLASGGNDGIVQVWAPANADAGLEPVGACPAGAGRVSSLAWADADRRLVLVVGGRVAACDVATFAVTELDPVTASVEDRDLAVARPHPQGTAIAVGGPGAPDAAGLLASEARSLRSLLGPSAGIRTLAWSPDGATLAGGGRDGGLHLWTAS